MNTKKNPQKESFLKVMPKNEINQKKKLREEKINLFICNIKKQNTNNITIFNKEKILYRIENNLENIWTGHIGVKHVYKKPENVKEILENCDNIINKYNDSTTLDNIITKILELSTELEQVKIHIHYLHGFFHHDNGKLLMIGCLAPIIVSGLNITYDQNELLEIINL